MMNSTFSLEKSSKVLTFLLIVESCRLTNLSPFVCLLDHLFLSKVFSFFLPPSTSFWLMFSYFVLVFLGTGSEETESVSLLYCFFLYYYISSCFDIASAFEWCFNLMHLCPESISLLWKDTQILVQKSIALWKVFGALHNPKGIRNS